MPNRFNRLGEEYPLTAIQEASNTKEKILLEAAILFARQGYGGVSMKDIAQKVGIKSASLYNHFPSKDALWDSVLNHARNLYLMYFSRLERERHPGQSFREMLETMFVELKTVVTLFSYYNTCLVLAEQFRDEKAGSLFLDVYLDYSIGYIAGRFQEYVDRGLARPFDTRAAAILFMNSVMMGSSIRVHQDMGRQVPYDAEEMFQSLQEFIMSLADVEE